MEFRKRPKTAWEMIEEKEQAGEGDKKIEQIRSQPGHVDRKHRGQDEYQRETQAFARRMILFEQQVTHQNGEKHHQSVEQEQALHIEQSEKRSREQGIGKGLGKAELPLGTLLQKKPFGSPLKPFIDTDDIIPGIFQIKIIGQALGNGKIGAFVAIEAPVHPLALINGQRRKENEYK